MPDAAITPDAYSPRVVSTSPAPGSIENPATPIRVGFDVDVSGVTTSSFRVTSMAGDLVPGTVTYDPVPRIATFDATDALPPNNQITVTLTSEIIDPVSARALMPTSYMFTTGADTTPPSVVATSPLNNATNVPTGANIVVTFDEPVANVTAASFQVDGGTVAGTITMSNGDRIATFDPIAGLPAASTVTVTLSAAINDTAGNPLTPVTFSFTTN